MIKTGNLENEIIDLSKELVLIDNVNLPFSSLLMKKATTKIGSIITNWKYENLDSSKNLAFEGADVEAFQSSDRSKGDKNVCQIINKAVAISDTAQAVSLDAIKDLFVHELNNRMLESKRDLEYYLINGVYNESETETEARQMKGLVEFVGEEYTTAKTTAPKITDLDEMSKMMRQAGTSSLNLTLLCDYNMFDIVTGLYDEKVQYIGVTNEFGSPAQKINLKFGSCYIYLVDAMPADTMVLVNTDHLQFRELRPLTYQDLAKTGSSRKGFIEMENTLGYMHPAAGVKYVQSA